MVCLSEMKQWNNTALLDYSFYCGVVTRNQLGTYTFLKLWMLWPSISSCGKLAIRSLLLLVSICFKKASWFTSFWYFLFKNPQIYLSFSLGFSPLMSHSLIIVSLWNISFRVLFCLMNKNTSLVFSSSWYHLLGGLSSYQKEMNQAVFVKHILTRSNNDLICKFSTRRYTRPQHSQFKKGVGP